jgi:hypothetical protein
MRASHKKYSERRRGPRRPSLSRVVLFASYDPAGAVPATNRLGRLPLVCELCGRGKCLDGRRTVYMLGEMIPSTGSAASRRSLGAAHLLESAYQHPTAFRQRALRRPGAEEHGVGLVTFSCQVRPRPVHRRGNGRSMIGCFRTCMAPMRSVIPCVVSCWLAKKKQRVQTGR